MGKMISLLLAFLLIAPKVKVTQSKNANNKEIILPIVLPPSRFYY